MEPSQQETGFRLLSQEEFDLLPQDAKVAYINTAIRVLTVREMTVAIIKPPEDEKK